VALAYLKGDFVAAEAGYPALERTLDTLTSDEHVGGFTYVMIRFLDEAGRLDRAAEAAEKYMKRFPALTHDDEGFAGRRAALFALHKARRIPDVEFRSKRAAWAEESKAKLPPRLANNAWLMFYADTVVTPADATEAFEALPRFSPLPSFEGDAWAERVMGDALLLVGRVDEAIPHLRHAVTACFDPEHVYSHNVAARLLGEALEVSGDKTGACAAYATVLARWGQAKPRSSTADKARERTRVLGCAM
jgi:tetratricopeptide (TPR) repeat protein